MTSSRLKNGRKKALYNAGEVKIIYQEVLMWEKKTTISSSIGLK